MAWVLRLVPCGRVTRMAATIAAIAALVAGCAGTRSPSAGMNSADSPGTTVFAPGAGPRVPPVTGSLLSGERLSLASYRGHVVVLNFWGSWCTICRQEASALSATSHYFKAKGVRFLGVDVADSTASAEAYLRHYRLDYPSLSDPSDQITLQFRGLIPVSAFPSTLVVSRTGRITGRIIGPVSYRGLKKLIQDAVAQA